MSDWNRNPSWNGDLNRRLRPSTSSERSPGAPDERLYEEIADALAFGSDSPSARPGRHVSTAAEQNDFQRRAVREMVAAFGGNTRALDARTRRIREEIYLERERQRIRNGERDDLYIEQEEETQEVMPELPASWEGWVLSELEAEDDETDGDDWDEGEVAFS